MLTQTEILSVLEMLRNENLDVRTVTLGLSLLDCASDDLKRFTTKIYDRITRSAERLVSVQGIEQQLMVFFLSSAF